MRRLLTFSVPLLGLLFAQGCDSSESDPKHPSSAKPSITLYATGTCGTAEGPTSSDLEGAPTHPIQVQVRGIDSATSSGIMKAGTEVQLTQSGAGAAIFASTLEDKPAEEVTLSFSGRTIEDALYCVSAGELTLKAKITGYTFKEESLTLEAEVTIRCLSVDDFEKACPEGARPVDAGVGADAMILEDACTGSGDMRQIESFDVAASAATCANSCSADADVPSCVQTCVVDDVRLSEGCASCYGDLILCALDQCAEACGADINSAGCLTCLGESSCAETFTGCSGVTLGGGEVIDVGVDAGAPSALCQGGEDSNIIIDETIDVIAKTVECGLGCVESPDGLVTCADRCIRRATGLSEPCTACYSELISCTLINCAEDCAQGFNAPCERCQQENNCIEPHLVCTGNAVVDPISDPPPQSWSISFVPQPDMVIGIRGTGAGRQDNILLAFEVEELGVPLRDVEVKFLMPENPPPGMGIDPARIVSNEQGVVTTRVVAGGTPGVLTIEARACRYGFVQNSTTECRPPEGWTEAEDGAWGCNARNINGCPEIARSGTVIIRGGVPSMRAFDFWCDHSTIPAFTSRPNIDNWLIQNSEETKCYVSLGDRLNGTVDTATQVFFLTEAGTITQSGATNDQGIAETIHRTGPPTPVNIPATDSGLFPNTIDVAIAQQTDDRALYTATDMNFRDGYVTLVAVTRGEENFLDSNGNKIYEPGVDIFSPEDDLTVPYVDSNDNGYFEQYCQERFGGEDGCDKRGRFYNEEFRGNCGEIECEFPEPDNAEEGYFGDGRWSGDIEIWKSTKVLWVGHMTAIEPGTIGQHKSYIMLSVDRQPEGVDPNICGGAGILTGQGTRIQIDANFVDDNGNCLGGYEVGQVDIDVTTEYIISSPFGESVEITGDLCFDFNQATNEVVPNPRPLMWLVTDIGPAPTMNPPQVTFKDHTIQVRYEGAGGGAGSNIINFEYQFRTCRLR
ncbi:hypothetical protein KKF91_07530 [Myxococcota bacterium]|nr:hypothetical protein [Myxococcota bacterium]